MIEKWKVIEITPNYSISNLGRIKNNKTNRILKPKKVRGYEYVCLRKDNKNLCKQVHRLVAKAFIPNPENKPCVNHKDYNRGNNCINNLEWVSNSENQLWSRTRISKGRSKNPYPNICQNKGGYVFQMRNGKEKRIRKWFKTLEEAVEFKNCYVAKMNEKGELELL
jgi:hypothetical protein